MVATFLHPPRLLAPAKCKATDLAQNKCLPPSSNPDRQPPERTKKPSLGVRDPKVITSPQRTRLITNVEKDMR
jgi:hypothetical protein